MAKRLAFPIEQDVRPLDRLLQPFDDLKRCDILGIR